MIDYLLENGIKSIMFWAIGLVVIAGSVYAFGLNRVGSFPPVPSAKWQAVFLSNNQVYFGKLQNNDANYLTLSDVYYLQTASELEQATPNSNLSLIKLGGEVHGPEDQIYIPKSSVLFWENMKDNSRVVQTINSTKQ